jgi:hypothetical protein
MKLAVSPLYPTLGELQGQRSLLYPCVSRSSQNPVRIKSCDPQVVPGGQVFHSNYDDGVDEVVIADSVVPIVSGLDFGSHSGSDHHPSLPLSSWSEVYLLPDYPTAATPTTSGFSSSPEGISQLPLGHTQFLTHNHYPAGESSVSPLQLADHHHRRADTNTAGQDTSDDRYTLVNSDRRAISTEHLNVLSDAMAKSQRVRRNSTGPPEIRVRRHSAAPSLRLNSQMQRHRRRSHDVRDEQADLLERLHVVATRRRSLSSPFQTSSRSHGSSLRPNSLRM